MNNILSEIVSSWFRPYGRKIMNLEIELVLLKRDLEEIQKQLAKDEQRD